MVMSGQLHAPATLPQGKAPGTHWVGDWVGPRAVLDAPLHVGIRKVRNRNKAYISAHRRVTNAFRIKIRSDYSSVGGTICKQQMDLMTINSITHSGIGKLLKKFKEIGSVADKPLSGLRSTPEQSCQIVTAKWRCRFKKPARRTVYTLGTWNTARYQPWDFEKEICGAVTSHWRLEMLERTNISCVV
jgi:hypothetical protein